MGVDMVREGLEPPWGASVYFRNIRDAQDAWKEIRSRGTTFREDGERMWCKLGEQKNACWLRIFFDSGRWWRWT